MENVPLNLIKDLCAAATNPFFVWLSITSLFVRVYVCYAFPFSPHETNFIMSELFRIIKKIAAGGLGWGKFYFYSNAMKLNLNIAST